MPIVRKWNPLFKRAIKGWARKYYGRLRRRRRPYIRRRLTRGGALIHSFKRMALQTRIETNNAGLAFVGYSFKLSDIPGFSEINSLFDQYRLNCVVIRFIYRGSNQSMIESAVNSGIGLPIMWYVKDDDDDNAPSNINELREYASCKMHCFTSERRVCAIKIKPRVLNEVYKSALTTAYGTGKRSWIDLADSGTTPHYGLKVAIEVPTEGVNNYAIQRFDVETKYYFQTRDPR